MQFTYRLPTTCDYHLRYCPLALQRLWRHLAAFCRGGVSRTHAPARHGIAAGHFPPQARHVDDSDTRSVSVRGVSQSLHSSCLLYHGSSISIIPRGQSPTTEDNHVTKVTACSFVALIFMIANQEMSTNCKRSCSPSRSVWLWFLVSFALRCFFVLFALR